MLEYTGQPRPSDTYDNVYPVKFISSCGVHLSPAGWGRTKKNAMSGRSDSIRASHRTSVRTSRRTSQTERQDQSPKQPQCLSRSPALMRALMVLPAGASGHCHALLYRQDGW